MLSSQPVIVASPSETSYVRFSQVAALALKPKKSLKFAGSILEKLASGTPVSMRMTAKQQARVRLSTVFLFIFSCLLYFQNNSLVSLSLTIPIVNMILQKSSQNGTNGQQRGTDGNDGV